MRRVIPVVQALLSKGAALGTVLAFMIPGGASPARPPGEQPDARRQRIGVEMDATTESEGLFGLLVIVVASLAAIVYVFLRGLGVVGRRGGDGARGGGR